MDCATIYSRNDKKISSIKLLQEEVKFIREVGEVWGFTSMKLSLYGYFGRTRGRPLTEADVLDHRLLRYVYLSSGQMHRVFRYLSSGCACEWKILTYMQNKKKYIL
jgi:hypothetical protein